MGQNKQMSELIARKIIEDIYGRIRRGYYDYISVDEYESLSQDEKADWNALYEDNEDGESELDGYSRVIDRNIWYGAIERQSFYTIRIREEVLKTLDPETVKEELQSRYEALHQLEDGHNPEQVYINTLDEIVMWALNGFIHL